MNKPIRILHAVSKMDRTGIESFIMNIYRNIDRTKIQFDFLDHNKDEGDFDKEILKLGGKIFKLNKLSSKYFLQYQKDLRLFFKNHKEYKIIHSHLNLLSAFTLKGAKKADIPTRIAHSHSNSFLNTGIKKLIKNYAKTQINKYTTDFFACSKEAGIWQFGKSKWNEKKIVIIPNGININHFKFSKHNRIKIRSNLNLNDSNFVVGHSGSFIDVKNHIFLIDIFFSLKKEIPNAKLVLIGRGILKTEIEDKCRNLNILEDVIFTGNIPNVNEYLSAMDCFIFPSKYEGLGISLIEAQTSGLPCFASDSIPIEANISKKTVYIPLNTKPEYWVNIILKQTNSISVEERTIPSESINFDIKQVSKNLENFYLNK